MATGPPTENDPTDFSNHGTHAAGVIGAVGDNGVGISGITQRVRIMPLVTWGAGSFGVAEAVTYAAREGVRVANGSFGIPYAQVIEDALAAAPNLLLSVSAGNQAWDVEQHKAGRYPCVSTLPNVICVAASDHGDNLAGFSNWGAESVDLGAPGVVLRTTGLPRYRVQYDEFENGLGSAWAQGGTGAGWGVTTGAGEWDRPVGRVAARLAGRESTSRAPTRGSATRPPTSSPATAAACWPTTSRATSARGTRCTSRPRRAAGRGRRSARTWACTASSGDCTT
jgi:subtilisin family serine protease